MRCWKKMEKIKWSEQVIYEESIGEDASRNILRRKANWAGHILRRNCLLHDVSEGQMTEVRGVGRRRTQLHDVLGIRRKYWELKEEVEDKKNK